jgi:hypothetical protein
MVALIGIGLGLFDRAVSGLSGGAHVK